jgi:UDP-N-acetylmuramyl pentapeptide phosphotransferase/UDP-N-acetylglucosamine-1-phosphate transferase
MTQAFVYPFLLSLCILLFSIYISHKHDLFIDDADHDKPQNYHTDSTPRVGGLGIMAGMFLILLFPLGIKFILPLTLAFLSGIFEDFHNSLSPRRRLSLQIIAALSAIWLTDSVVTYLGLGIHMPYWMGIFFSTFAIVGMMNAVNIIDGFNGLASGIILLILLSFGITSYTENNLDIFYVVLVTAGSTLAFFVLNFPKGKIFLGDGGAYMLGFIVAIIGIYLASKYESVSPWYVLAIFIYPVWEVLFSIIRKLSIGLSPMKPDTYHIHMLVYRQVTRNKPLTALFILVFTFPFMTISTVYPDRSITNITVAFCFILSYVAIYQYLYRKDRQTKK